MERNEVTARIQKGLPEAEVTVEGADCDFSVRVISSEFVGLSPVKRQQLIYTYFSDVLADGQLHALTIHAHTPGEWQSRLDNALSNILF